MFSIVWTQFSGTLLSMSVTAIVSQYYIFCASDLTSFDFMEPNEWYLKRRWTHSSCMNRLLKDIAVALIIISILKILIWHITCLINNLVTTLNCHSRHVCFILCLSFLTLRKLFFPGRRICFCPGGNKFAFVGFWTLRNALRRPGRQAGARYG